MIKLICLGAVPLLAAFVYGQRDPEPMVPASYSVEESDRIFLANLDVEEKASRESVARDEQELMAQRLASQPVPVAMAVAMPPPAPKAPPIPRAALVRAAAPATPATSAPDVTLAFGGTSLPRNETTPASTEPEVRRAIPLTNAIPVARAIPAPAASNRPSTGPYQGEVFTFSSYSGR
jgi:hypothetical protein